MGGRRRLFGFGVRMAVLMAAVLLFDQNLKSCSCMNSEGLALLRFREKVVADPFGALSNWNDGDGELDPCSWFGVECSDGEVVVLNLKDLCLRGTLAPELGNLVYIRSIILRNNLFSGNIPTEIGVLRELEVLDLGYNNFTGPFLPDIGNILSLTTLLLENNKFLGGMSPELYKLKTVSEFQRDEKLTTTVLGACCDRTSITCNTAESEKVAAYRRQLQMEITRKQRKARKGSHVSPSPSPSSVSPSPSQLESPVSSPSTTSTIEVPAPASPDSANPPTVISTPPHFQEAPIPSPALNPIPAGGKHSKSKHHTIKLMAGVTGGSIVIFFLVFAIIFIQRSKVVTVKPWATGLSGQLQKAFVTGVPKLKRSELEAACEDFSNIIGSLSDGVVYKGNLSSGVEIAVTSSAVTSTEDWSKTLESLFRKKIATLSKVNHKNFVNLIGYCEEEQPFTRMMVFEYAPNGTLFEHLHIKEADHLDWGMRLRIAMGMAYCLEHMHQLTPPVAHENLQSSSIYLTEDYAAKISDFSFWNDITAAKIGSAAMELLHTPSADPGSNIYNFGVILLEIITGRIPYAEDDGSLSDWASRFLSGEQPLGELVDPTLKTFQYDELEKLLEVIRSCVHRDLYQRPTMKEIAARLKEITTMEPDGATPKLSPLWWAELEIMSSESS